MVLINKGKVIGSFAHAIAGLISNEKATVIME
jgi:hypothetical protein